MFKVKIDISNQLDTAVCVAEILNFLAEQKFPDSWCVLVADNNGLMVTNIHQGESCFGRKLPRCKKPKKPCMRQSILARDGTAYFLTNREFAGLPNWALLLRG